MVVFSAQWLLIPWCYSSRPSVSTVLSVCPLHRIVSDENNDVLTKKHPDDWGFNEFEIPCRRPCSTMFYLRQVKSVMETAVRMIDVISETLLEDTVVGDPLHLMHYGDLVWVVAKMAGKALSNFSLTFNDLGTIKYPDEVFVDDVPTCVEMKVGRLGLARGQQNVFLKLEASCCSYPVLILLGHRGEIAPTGMPREFTIEKSTLAQLWACRHQAARHYLD